MLPMAVLDEDVRNISGVDMERLEWIGFTDTEASYVLYDDDGISKQYAPKENWKKIVRTKEALDVTA